MSKAGLFCMVFFLATPQLSRSQARIITRLDYRWEPHRPPYHFLLEFPNYPEGPDGVTRLTIVMPNGHMFSVDYLDPFDKISDAFIVHSALAENLARSEYFYFSPLLRNKWGTPALMLFGYAYASSPGTLDIYELDSLGVPRRVFHRNFSLVAIQDLSHDGHYELIGKHTISQMWGKCFLTYDPFTVYSLPSSGTGQATLSLKLSRSYNLKHYYGWAGPNSSEKLTVVLCAKGGKPLIMSARKAERLYGQHK